MIAVPLCGPMSIAASAPRLTIEAPASLELFAETLRGTDPAPLAEAAALVGLEDPGPPIRVILAEETSPAGRQAPSWAEGYAFGSEGVVVLIPGRARAYPYGSLEALLHHEVAHVLIDRAARGHPVPRWFHEGVAMAAARRWTVADRGRLVVEMIPGRRIGPGELDELFRRGEGPARGAYTLSGAFVRDLLRRHGPRLPSRILPEVGGGMPFDEAFRRATGESPSGAADAFYRRENIWSRWVPLLTSTFTVWTGISLLALWAIRRRRARDARRKEEWAMEEAVHEAIESGRRWNRKSLDN